MKILRTLALIALAIGAVGTLVLFFRATDRTPPLLIVLFVGWLLMPFAILAGARVASKRWAATTQAALHGVTIVTALASLAIYGNVIRITPQGSPKAAPFVVAAPASLLLAAVVISLAALVSRRRTH